MRRGRGRWAGAAALALNIDSDNDGFRAIPIGEKRAEGAEGGSNAAAILSIDDHPEISDGLDWIDFGGGGETIGFPGT